jgi:hypothetical protein
MRRQIGPSDSPHSVDMLRTIRSHGYNTVATSELGILDVTKPDFGEPQIFEEGEVPVFWVSSTHLRFDR